MSTKPAIPESLAWYRESVTWLTALASGALAAGAALYQRSETLALSEPLRWVLLAGGAVFVFVIISGVACYSYLAHFANHAENGNRVREQIADLERQRRRETGRPAEAKLRIELATARETLASEQREARRGLANCGPWYRRQLYGYGVGMFLFAVAAFISARGGLRDPAPAVGTYAFANSPAGMLVMDTRTGQTWQMVQSTGGLQLQPATPVIPKSGPASPPAIGAPRQAAPR